MYHRLVHPGTNLARRLSKLFHHGLLDRVQTALGAEVIYPLATAGANQLQSGLLPLFVPEGVQAPIRKKLDYRS